MLKTLAIAGIASLLAFGSANAAECAHTYDGELAALKALGPQVQIVEVGPGPGLDALDALIASDSYAGKDFDFDAAIIANNDTQQYAIVGLFKDGCYVQSGPMQKADYFKLLPTIKGI